MNTPPTPSQSDEKDQPTQWAPALDVLHEDGDLMVRAELPGVKQEDVDITFHDEVLTISGERKAEEQKEGSGYYVRERLYGSFRRSMTFPYGTDESNISLRTFKRRQRRLYSLLP